MRWLLLLIFLAISSTGVYVYFYLGFTKPVHLTGLTTKSFHLVYKEHIGSYQKIAKVIEDVEAWAKENNIDCSLSFGRYLDDPNVVEEDRLRSWGGCVAQVESKKLQQDKDLKTYKLAEARYATAIFKGSPAIGPLKVYPKLFDWIGENNHRPKTGGSLETYFIDGESVESTYYIPVD